MRQVRLSGSWDERTGRFRLQTKPDDLEQLTRARRSREVVAASVEFPDGSVLGPVPVEAWEDADEDVGD